MGTTVRSARADHTGWAMAIGSAVVLAPVFAGLALAEPVFSEDIVVLAGMVPLAVVPAALGLINGLRAGAIATTLAIGVMPAVTALLVNVGERVLRTVAVEPTLLGSALVFGAVGIGAALCGLWCGRRGRAWV